MEQRDAPLVALERATKKYPGVLALDDVDFTMAPGEVRALLGKNGAGKSTLIKVLGGAERLNSGTLRVAGTERSFRGPKDAIAAGIATVHQELASVPQMTVAENISLGRWPNRPGLGIDWRAVRSRAQEALAMLGVDIRVDALLVELSLAEMQLIEIARALSLGARLLILDEPTSSLAEHEVSLLMTVIRRLSASGIGIIYISHRIDEIQKIASSVTVMRDGRAVGTLPIEEATPARVVGLMVGDAKPPEARPDSSVARGPVILKVDGLSIRGKVADASFVVHEGEVLGLAGLLGSGRTEILRAIVGAQRAQSGRVVLGGRELVRRSIRSTRSAGLVLTPEDRRAEGVVVILGVDENLVMSAWEAVSPGGVIGRRAVRRMVSESIERLSIKVSDPKRAVATLSGGNQQKVVIGKALNTKLRVLLMDEPTKGIDVEAKTQIYRLIRQMAAERIGVVVVSSETEELLEFCDRVVVLRGGRTREDVLVHQTDRDSLFEHMMRRDEK